MPKRSDDYHGGGSGWRFSWRPDRMQRLHELGQEFDLTDDREVRRNEIEEEKEIGQLQPGEERRTKPIPRRADEFP
jgi:hypothetical protein